MRQKNIDRAERASAAVEAWLGQRGDRRDECSPRDLISDLLHLIERENAEPNFPPEQQHQSAWNRYEEERDGDPLDMDEEEEA